MIAVIDYGMGNLGSVSKALEHLGGDVRVTQKASDLRKADKIVLPGVGAFRDTVDALTQLGLLDVLKKEILSGKVYLGLCLGLQLLFEESEEGGQNKGLGILRGRVVRFNGKNLKIPQIGWNKVSIRRNDCPLFKGIDENSFFYFVHSYYIQSSEKKVVAAVTDYGGEFTSMVWKDNIYAVQFHPEKSQRVGLKFLENFLRL